MSMNYYLQKHVLIPGLIAVLILGAIFYGIYRVYIHFFGPQIGPLLLLTVAIGFISTEILKVLRRAMKKRSARINT